MTDTDRNSPAESIAPGSPARSHSHLILLHSNSEVRNWIQRLLASDYAVETTAMAATARRSTLMLVDVSSPSGKCKALQF